MDERTQALRHFTARYLDRLLMDQTELQSMTSAEEDPETVQRKAKLDELLLEIEACKVALAYFP